MHLVLRGLAEVARTPGQQHGVWILSHPEAIDVTECDAADLVLVASPRFAAHLRTRTDTPVDVLLQATDAHRFHPVTPVAAHQHPVTVVAKTRNVMRPAVAMALAAGTLSARLPITKAISASPSKMLAGTSGSTIVSLSPITQLGDL